MREDVGRDEKRVDSWSLRIRGRIDGRKDARK